FFGHPAPERLRPVVGLERAGDARLQAVPLIPPQPPGWQAPHDATLGERREDLDHLSAGDAEKASELAIPQPPGMLAQLQDGRGRGVGALASGEVADQRRIATAMTAGRVV